MVDHVNIGRIGLAGGVKRTHEFAKRACDLASGGLYKSPTSTDTVDASKPMTISWDTSCPITTSTIDIYLYANSGNIHGWGQVPFSAGSYEVTLSPKWWNSTSEATLQFGIVEAGALSFASVPGPYFKATYPQDALKALTSTSISSGAVAPAATSVVPEFQQYSNPKPSGLPAGSLAAAIVVPVVAVLIAIGVYVRFARMKEAEKRKRWSAAVDRRMSTISQDWRAQSVHGSINPGGPGGRPSMQSNRQTRASSYMGRTSSTYAVENNMAGAGAGNRTRVRPDGSAPEMRQMNNDGATRGSLFTPSDRISRVSFADARTSRVSFGDALRPTVSNISSAKNPASRSATNLTTPERLRSSILNRNSSAVDDDDLASLSPSQVTGPLSYNDKDVKRMSGKGKVGKRIARKSVGDWEGRASADDFRNAEDVRSSVDQLREMEAVMLMRRSKAMSQYSVPEEPSPVPSGSAFASPADTNQMEELALPAQPAAAMRASSPMGMPLPSASLSPDEMLAAYAAARRNGPVGTVIEQASTSHLRSPPATQNADRLSVVSNNPFRASLVSNANSEASYYSADAPGKAQ